jgi:hypothetical protein
MPSVEHTSAAAQEAFLAKTPAQQNLEIWLSSRETNGSVAEALRRIGKLEELGIDYDRRIAIMEHWQLKAAAVIGAAIAAGPGFFFLLNKLWD